MRCFVAIPPPSRVKQELLELQKPIKKVRWQNEKQLHITLKFLGEVSEDKAKELRENLKAIQQAPFSISLKGFGYFGRKKPRVLWAGVEKNDSLGALRDKVESVCVSAGFEAEDRPFRPHITLARMKGASRKEIDSFIKKHQQFEKQAVLVDEFSLYESRLRPEGAEYLRLETFYLGDG